MHFITIYDIQQAGCRYGFLPIIVGALSSYAAVEWYRGKRWKAWTPAGYVTQPGYSPGPFCLFFAILTLLTFALTWGSYYSLTRAIRGGAVQTLEGVVSDFQPAANLKARERFSLGGHVFSYSKYAVKQGFNTLRIEGSPIADGTYVRLVYRDDSILRLQIRSASQ